MSLPAPDAALEVAATIGFGIARKAVWSGERCSWLEAYPVMPGQNPAVSAMCGADVYGGTAGIGWFLAEAAIRTGDALLLRTARAALRQTAARAAQQVASAPHGFYGGAAGAGAVLSVAGQRLGDEESLSAGRALLLDCPTGTEDPFATDIISGLAGTVVAFILAASALGDDAALLGRASAAAAALIERGERDAAGGLSWASMADRRANLTGFGHGAAGIAHAFVLLDAVVPQDELREAAGAAYGYERGLFDPVQGNWPDFRIMPGFSSDQVYFPVAWCHGAAGIAQGRLAAAAAGFAVEADLAAGIAATMREAQRALHSPGSDFTLCHGVLGLADMLWDAVRSGRTEGAGIVEACAAYAIRAFHEAERPWPSGLLTREEISGLMMGNAGIGWFFLRLADPTLESVLVPGAGLIAQPGDGSAVRTG